MLESLTIRNYAIIAEMTVQFPGGLTVITGETGAGKSIVIDALELVLGARASAEMIRAGSDELEVSGVFTHDASIRDEEFPIGEDDDVLILRREVRADGSSRCFVNDQPVTLKSLKKLGDRLVDLHGQHDHQSLLMVTDHVRFLDGYGGLGERAEAVGRLFHEYVTVRASIARMKERIENSRRDRDLYRFQSDEIDNANILPNEDEELEQSIRRLSRATELKELGWRAFQVLSDAEGSVEEVLGSLAGSVGELAQSDSGLAPLAERMEELTGGVSELAGDFRRYADAIEDDPATLAEIEERLAFIERLKKKYGPRLDDVFAFREKIGKETVEIEELEHELKALESTLGTVGPNLFRCARELSAKRRKASPELAREVEAHLAELGMSGAKLVIEIGKNEGGIELAFEGAQITVGKEGADRVEFMFSANPGVPPRPLVKIASGGEVSRVMLALKLALSSVDSVPTMVFDEIDVGVSGRVAEAVGNKLLKLSGKRQVVVITHLPQIAGKTVSHFSARKTVEKGMTQASLVALDENMRQKELAAMLSGEKLTDTALAHARELMKKPGNDG
ncbi:DNA repair protein RecN [bacterium]|nr:DNA repair protein RecN [bacterium]